jgi:hypothetical protein
MQFRRCPSSSSELAISGHAKYYIIMSAFVHTSKSHLRPSTPQCHPPCALLRQRLYPTFGTHSRYHYTPQELFCARLEPHYNRNTTHNPPSSSANLHNVAHFTSTKPPDQRRSLVSTRSFLLNSTNLQRPLSQSIR